MFFAAKTGNLEVVQQLISRGASVELKDKVMYTVELPNNGHIGSGPFVLCIEVVPL